MHIQNKNPPHLIIVVTLPGD